MKSLKFLLSLLCVFALASCSKEDRAIYFKPDRYTISAAGGETLTAVPNRDFMLSGSGSYPLKASDHYYYANKDGAFLETDFFTAEKTAEGRIKFVVAPNTTGKERTHIIEVSMLDIFGELYLTQTAN